MVKTDKTFLHVPVYELMNKDSVVAKIACRREHPSDPPEFSAIEIYGPLPFGFRSAGEWLENRRAPRHRKHIVELLDALGCKDTEGYLQLTHGASLNDTFWLRSEGRNETWSEISLYRNEFDEIIARLAFEGGVADVALSSPTPELDTDGMFAKCWRRMGDSVYLLKQGSEGASNAGREPYSERYAYEIAKCLCSNPVKYDLIRYHGRLASRCELFCSEQTGYTPIVNILGKDASFEDCIRYYDSIGCGEEFREMIVMDAVTLNTDRHLKNFGVLFDTDTLAVRGMAPVFDNNLSLLPYATEEGLRNPQPYIATRQCAFGDDFNILAHKCLTPKIENRLKALRAFSFSRNEKLALPDERLTLLENIIHCQVESILQNRPLKNRPEPKGTQFVSAFLTFSRNSLSDEIYAALTEERFSVSDFFIKDEIGVTAKVSGCRASVSEYENLLEIEIYDAKIEPGSNLTNIIQIDGLTVLLPTGNNIMLIPKDMQIQTEQNGEPFIAACHGRVGFVSDATTARPELGIGE